MASIEAELTAVIGAGRWRFPGPVTIREVLGFDVRGSEDGPYWKAFLRSSKARGPELTTHNHNHWTRTLENSTTQRKMTHRRLPNRTHTRRLDRAFRTHVDQPKPTRVPMDVDAQPTSTYPTKRYAHPRF